jgi:hypothetical protein
MKSFFESVAIAVITLCLILIGGIALVWLADSLVYCGLGIPN